MLDGLLYHESDLRIEEHYTDTAGFTDHVFALTHLLGFRFAPRIRDLADKRLFMPSKSAHYSALAALNGGTINVKHIRSHWDEILRLAASIRQGTVTASLMLRKLGSYPRQNGLARAVFFNRLGEMRERSFENQRYRASGLNLVTAAIVLWNTVYLERAIQAIKERGQPVDENLLSHLSPLGWEYINLTGDYVWQHSRKPKEGKFRPLRPFPQA